MVMREISSNVSPDFEPIKGTSITLIPKHEWDRINRRFDVDETLREHDAYRKYLKDASSAMTANWKDSVEMIAKRKYDNIARKSLDVPKLSIEGYNTIRREQQRERDVFNERVFRQMYVSRQPGASLTQAFNRARIVAENDKQLELKERLRRHAREENLRDAEVLKETTEREKIEDVEKEIKNYHLAKSFSTYNFQLAANKKKWKLAEKEADIRYYKDTVKQMELDEELLVGIQREDKLSSSISARSMLLTNHDKNKALRNQQKSCMDDVDYINERFKETTLKRYCRAKNQVKKEIEDRRTERIDNLVKYLANKTISSGQDERIKQQASEIEKKYQIEIAKKMEHKIKADKEIADNLKLRRKQATEERLVRDEMVRYGMHVRYKQQEAIRVKDIETANKISSNKMAYKRQLLDQMEEKQKRLQEDKLLNEKLIKVESDALLEKDEKFFEYAQEILDQTEEMNLIKYPAYKAIGAYRKTTLLPQIVNVPCKNIIPTARIAKRENGKSVKLPPIHK